MSEFLPLNNTNYSDVNNAVTKLRDKDKDNVNLPWHTHDVQSSQSFQQEGTRVDGGTKADQSWSRSAAPALWSESTP